MNPSNLSLGKSLPVPSSHSPSVPSGSSTTSFDSSRRPGPVGSSNSSSIPRKGQSIRKQQKSQRRPAGGERASSAHVDFDDMAEIRALRNPNSRRGQTSITHLLNYSTSRPYQDHSSYARSYRKNPTWGPNSGHHSSDKARYVNANYRFVVSPHGSYIKHAADPDSHLDWGNVMQVIASSESQVTSCPICLSEPVAPRMAKCGHIFCLPCLIRFMNSSSNEDDAKSSRGPRWKKCPICEDLIYLHEVRPVRFYSGQESPLPRVGDDVILRLMARNTASNLALPREGAAELLNLGHELPWHYAVNALDYARVMKGTKEYMSEQFNEEITALERQAREDETLFGQDGEWMQKGVRAVLGAIERLSAENDAPASTPTNGQNSTHSSSEADFYFYSAPPHLYLSPLDIRILKTKYGSFASFPSTLLPRVEHISTGHVVDDTLRKRAKYLGHLPRGCVVSFLECDWTDIIPAETLESFAADIERRRKRNRDKAMQEERERQQAERLEAAEIRRATGSRRLAEPLEEERAPTMDLSEFQPLSTPSGTTPPDPRPGFESLAEMSSSPLTQRTIWGTRAINMSPELAAQPSEGPVDDGWLREDELLGTSGMAMQMEALSMYEQANNDTSPVPTGNGSSGGKRKKKQKITLMSTGGRRGN